MSTNPRRWSLRFLLILIGLFLIVTVFYYRLEVSEILANIPERTALLVVSVATGVIGSLVAALIYSLFQKEVWKKDTEVFEKAIKDIDEKIARLGVEYESFLRSLPQALGGKFTRSLFEFHPMVSAQIARILSEETGRQYDRHHKKVIVTKANDLVRIEQFKPFSGTPDSPMIWELAFRTRWVWNNDSRVPKNPLGDLLILVIAPDQALNSIHYGTLRGREDEQKRFKEFIGKTENRVLSILPHPQDPRQLLSEDELQKLFAIDSLEIWHRSNHMTIKGGELESFPSKDLPKGIYRAFQLANSAPLLEAGESMDIEYIGRICLPAETVNNNYRGHLKFPPSDVIGDEYQFTLTYPEQINIGDKRMRLKVLEEQSGCQFLHGPLECAPQERTTTGAPPRLKEAEIKVDYPLTELYQISMAWEGEIIT